MATGVLNTFPEDGVMLATWSALAGSENGDSVTMSRYTERCVSASGTFTTIDVQGSNDGVNFFACHKMDGTACQLAAAGILKILEDPRFLRVVSVGAAGCLVIICGVQVAN